MNKFAERLKQLREDKGLSIRQLANKINVSHMTISRWEKSIGSPTVESVIAFSKFFGVTTDYLLGLED